MANLKLKRFCGDQKLEQGSVNLLQIKVFTSAKRYKTVYGFKRAHLKTRDQGDAKFSDFLLPGDMVADNIKLSRKFLIIFSALTIT